MALHHCGTIPIGTDYGNGTCVGVNMTSSPNIYPIEVVVELYLITTICVIGVVGNVLSVYVLRSDEDRKEAMLPLQILALADMFYLCVAFLNYPMKHLLSSSNLYIRMQLYVFPLLKLAQALCIWMMLLVTVDRYVYVCLPLRALRLLTPTRRRLLAAGVAVCAVLYNLPRFFDSCLMIFEDQCTGRQILVRKVFAPSFNNKYYYDIYIYCLSGMFLYVIPLVCLLILNKRLISAIHVSRKKHIKVKSGVENTESNSTLVLVIIIVVFILCQTPELVIHVMTLVERWADKVHIPMTTYRTMSVMTGLLAVINSSSNFFIYMCLGRRFKYVIRKKLKKVLRKEKGSFTVETIPLRSPKR